ncbi:hypothetical protein [Actinoplanes siamensis]|uniref:hypothetical protein n=1 Tax=Actinoplanes siamensis TaxID=1223317 RepID=UPI0019404A8B|nr:hypothetical protein [Actinoplanes siamensis]
MFIGVLLIGLPFAVVVGWALGTPIVRTVAAPETRGAGGSGALGVSPDPTETSTGGYATHAPRPAGGDHSPIVVVNSTVITKTVTVAASPPPAAPPASTIPPIVSMPPVPTPTQITGPPEPTPTPSESPSESAEAAPSSPATPSP